MGRITEFSNGSNGKLTIALISFLFGIIATAVSVGVVFGGVQTQVSTLVETQQALAAKQERLLEAEATHESTPGHPVIVERVRGIEEDIGDIKKDVNDILTILQRR